MNHKWRTKYILLSGLIGSVALCILSALQKCAFGMPIAPQLFAIPILFGFFTGSAISFWHTRTVILKKELKLKYDAQNDRYQAIINASPVGIFQSDPDGRYQMVNNRFSDIVGYTPEELLNENFTALNLFADPNDRSDLTTELQKKGLVHDKHLSFRRKDGKLVWISIFAKLQNNEDGQFYDGFVLDITSNKEAELAVKKSAARFQRLTENSIDAIYLLDTTGHVRDVNNAACKALKMNRDQLLKLTIEDIDLEFDLNKFCNFWMDQPQDQAVLFETTHRRSDGYEFPVEVNGVIFNEDGEQFLFGIARDITERNIAHKILEEREAQFRALFEQAAWAVFVHDSNGNFIDVNKKSCEQLGYSKDELLTKKIFDIDIDALERGSDPSFWMAVQSEGTSFEGRHKRKNGQFFPVSVTLTSINYHDRLAYVALVQDITDLTETRESLIRAKEEAESANKSKSIFLANMSHEMRTPLNGVLGMLQLLETTNIDDEQKELIEAGIQSSKRLNRLLSDILDLSRIEADRLVLRNEFFDLYDSINEVFELFKLTTSQKNVNLNVAIHPDIPQFLIGDSTRLKQVLTNIVGNSFKFTDHGAITLEAYPLPAMDDTQFRVLFMVKDTGIGMDSKIIDKLFTPFTQASEGFDRQYEGAGLGLSICKKIIDLMDGHISIDSESGEGTTIYFCLNLQTDRRSKAMAHMVSKGNLNNKTGISILIVEDDEVSQFVTKRWLSKKNHLCKTVNNGLEALKALSTDNYDLILMDIQLPEMDGVLTTQAIRKGEAGKDNEDIPIIAMTAFAMAGDKEKFLAAGMNDFLSKPVDLNDLQTLLNKYLHFKCSSSYLI